MTARQELIHRTARRAAAYLVEVGVTGHRAQIEDEVIRQLVDEVEEEVDARRYARLLRDCVAATTVAIRRRRVYLASRES